MKQIYNKGQGGRTDRDISIHATGITLLRRFRARFKVSKFVGLYINDDGFLCLKFYEEGTEPMGVSRTNWQCRNGVTPVIIVSSKTLDKFGIKVGFYTAEEDGDLIVTSCKAEPRENS